MEPTNTHAIFLIGFGLSMIIIGVRFMITRSQRSKAPAAYAAVRCPYCGGVNRLEATACQVCGRYLYQPPPAPPAAVQPAPPAQQDSAPGTKLSANDPWHIICSRCGNEQSSGSDFCGKCGAKLE
jgi:rRNA maturation endonuclease Nob1